MIEKQSSKLHNDSDLIFTNSNDFKNSSRDKMGKFAKSFFESIQVIVIALAVVVLVYIFVASFNIVDGESMIPNFESGDLIIAEKITPNFGQLHRGDVIVFAAPEGKDYIKRIIGLPGEKVKVDNGKVYINGIPITENYLSDENKSFHGGQVYADGDEVSLPINNYYVMGDNRKNSRDSRDIGYIDKSKIKGRAWLIFWHQNKPEFNILKRPSYLEYPDAT